MDLSSSLVDRIKNENINRELRDLSPNGFPSIHVTRRIPENEGYRTPFMHDADRIIHSLSYARYFDKTQVFFWLKSDLHQNRLLHVQLVSRLSRTIGHILHLNEELLEAIALGHDIGHAPFGHDGEEILSQLCEKKHIGFYNHNYGSVWFLQEIENQNLTLPVLDGILGHNGESHKNVLKPHYISLNWEDFDASMERVHTDKHYDPLPSTLEGCLVRFVDTISYISRDIMDAENLHLVSFNQLPDSIQNSLGKSNREIINTLVSDLITNSLDKPYISYSLAIFTALHDLYHFNFTQIYSHPQKVAPLKKITEAFHAIWDEYLTDLINKRTTSRIYRDHLDLNLKQIQVRTPAIHSLKTYPYAQQPPEIIVRDYLAGMTDQYFWELAGSIDPNLVFHAETVY